MTAVEDDAFVRALTGQLPALRRYAMVLVGSVSAADDLVQDCIERALKQAAKLEDQKRIGGWLRSILHNLHVDELRRRRRQGVNVNLADVETELALVTPAADHAAALDFNRAMATLSLEHRQVILLVGLEGLSYHEVAEELRIPIGTVMSRLARARERLRSAMDRDKNEATAPTEGPPQPGQRV